MGSEKTTRTVAVGALIGLLKIRKSEIGPYWFRKAYVYSRSGWPIVRLTPVNIREHSSKSWSKTPMLDESKILGN